MIEFQNVTKEYGNVKAIDNFSISIKMNGIYCLLGRNGAGKTTFLKLLAGHINSSEGLILVDNKSIGTLKMPDNICFTESGASQFNMKLNDLFSSAKDINPDFDSEFAIEISKRFKLNLQKRIRQLSFGMKTMVNTIIAMASSKEIILLDEPVLGFDPVMRKNFYDLLQESCMIKPKIVIISTHIIDEISRVAEQLIIIDKGILKLFTDINEIDENTYCVTGIANLVEEATKGLNIIGKTRAGGFLSVYVYDQRIEESNNYTITSLGLQDFFVGLVGDNKEED